MGGELLRERLGAGLFAKNTGAHSVDWLLSGNVGRMRIERVFERRGCSSVGLTATFMSSFL